MLLKGDVKGALAGGQQAMQLISVWCPYCLAIIRMASTRPCPLGQLPIVPVGERHLTVTKNGTGGLEWHNLPVPR
jgi:hypothetical protein